MWWTSDGQRILKGAEAALFREALGVLVDYVCQDEDGTIWQFGAPPFDTLQYGQKLAVLAQVGSGLLREDEPAPKLTAVLEGTVAVIYGLVRDMVQLEIDDPEMAGPPAGHATVRETLCVRPAAQAVCRSVAMMTRGRQFSTGWRSANRTLKRAHSCTGYERGG